MQKILNRKLVDDGVDHDESDLDDEAESSTASSTANTSPEIPVPTPPKRPKGRPRLIPLDTPTIKSTTVTPSSVAVKNRTPPFSALKKKLLNLQRYLTDFTISGRHPMALFMEKPSKKLYPDYYEVIRHPIDLNTIKTNIDNDRYTSIQQAVSDYRLMFSNCRQYNEEHSMIYEDANILEKALDEKLKDPIFIDKRFAAGKL